MEIVWNLDKPNKSILKLPDDLVIVIEGQDLQVTRNQDNQGTSVEIEETYR